MVMDFGTGLGRNNSTLDAAEISQLCEEAGFSHLTFVDMGNVAREVHVNMTIAALATKRIKIGHGVIDPIMYDPQVIANATASLYELSGGRAFVGIGAGQAMGKPLGRPATMAELREAVNFIRDYTEGNDATLRGFTWHCEWLRESPLNGKIPIWMGPIGPRSLQLSGELADAVFVGQASPFAMKWAQDQIARGAEKAGRDPSKIEVWSRTQIIIAPTKEAARREAAPYAATKACSVYNTTLSRPGPEADELRRLFEQHHPGMIDEFRQIWENRDVYKVEAIGGRQDDFTTQRVIDYFLLTGTVDDICERISQLEALGGVTGVSTVQFAIINQTDQIKQIANEIIPKFRPKIPVMERIAERTRAV